MLQSLIDRRLSGRHKSIGNRERFLRRYREQVKEAVRRAIDGRGIRDLERGDEVRIPRKDISEPVFGHGPGGVRETVHPGNQDHLQGDRLARPRAGDRALGPGQASDDGLGEDEFAFALSKEEFMQVFFEDLELPNLLRTELAATPQWKVHRAGLTHEGTASNLHVVRSLRGALARRLALGAADRRELARLQDEAGELPPHGDEHPLGGHAQASALRQRLARIPWIDPIDLRYRSRVRQPEPTSQAVMFCLMDVSGSMDEQRKELSKRFFILLYLFLTRHYERIEVVFIRHHTQASEVEEQDFFHARETGGTVVSSALVLMDEIIRSRYDPQQWNIYGAQASDGDNWHHDSGRCRELLADRLLPLCRHFAYVQVADEEQNLWQEYGHLAASHPHFAMRKATEARHIYPVFRDLFRREAVAAACPRDLGGLAA